MAVKKIGQQDWLGAAFGYGYFVKYCPNCREKIYLAGKYELQEFLSAVPHMSLWRRYLWFFKARLRFPKISVSFTSPIENELSRRAERIEVGNIINMTSIPKPNVKQFNRSFFDGKYERFGGVEKLEQLIAKNVGASNIARTFGFSVQRAQQIVSAYRQRLVV